MFCASSGKSLVHFLASSEETLFGNGREETVNVEYSRIAKGRGPNSPRVDITRFDVLPRHTVRRIHLTLETSLRFFLDVLALRP